MMVERERESLLLYKYSFSFSLETSSTKPQTHSLFTSSAMKEDDKLLYTSLKLEEFRS